MLQMTYQTKYRSTWPDYPDSGQGKKGSLRLPIKTLPIGGVIMLASTLFVSGCSRKSSDTANSQANAQTTQAIETANSAAPAQPGPAAVQPGPAAASIILADGQPDMAELNRVARLWILRNQRRPTSWENFAAHAGVQIPPPPPGKKFVLNKDMRVTLVDR